MASKFSSSKQIWNQYKYSILWLHNYKSHIYQNDNYLSKNYKLTTISFSPLKLRNRCVYTNRSRAIFNDIKLTRMAFKNLAFHGFLNGIKHYSW